jgi:hypothetical protein
MLLILGCEREKRAEGSSTAKQQAAEPSMTQGRSIIDADGWLSVFARNGDGLAQFAESSTLWGSLLQGRYIEVLTAYDGVSKPSSADGLVCARASLELASTSFILETLLQSVQRRVLEIQSSRTGVEKVAVLRAFFMDQAASGLTLEVPVWATSRPSFLPESMSEEDIQLPGTGSYQSRWALLRQIQTSGKLPTTKGFLKRVTRLTGSDFQGGVGDAVFEYADLGLASVSRHFYARKALACLALVDSEVDLLKMKALRLSGDKEGAISVLKQHRPPNVLPVGIQLLTLDTSVDAYEQSILVESVKLGVLEGAVSAESFPSSVPLSQLRLGLAVGHGSDGEQKKAVAIQQVDPVILSRTILKSLGEGAVSDEETASVLISRYVNEVLRKTADAHFLKGEFARSAQVRRRIGGTGAFVIGPKVPPSALAKCALEHWKIVEPRSAIRYLKDLGSIFPNAKRSAGLLRDVLSYRARQSGGQTAAGQ